MKGINPENFMKCQSKFQIIIFVENCEGVTLVLYRPKKFVGIDDIEWIRNEPEAYNFNFRIYTILDKPLNVLACRKDPHPCLKINDVLFVHAKSCGFHIVPAT